MKVLFIGQCHRVNDPRLAHREMKSLKYNISDINFYFLQYPHRSNSELRENALFPQPLVSQVNIAGFTINHLIFNDKRPALFRFLGLLFKRGSENIVQKVANYFRGTTIDVVQASDVREIAFATRLSEMLNSKLIYDSHEDYIRQVLDYGNKSFRSYVWACAFLYIEARFIKKCHHVFCTDEFLHKKYNSWYYYAKKVVLLRNFPLLKADDQLQRNFKKNDTLKLVYIGGINQFRGVIEAAQYIKKFNEIAAPRKLELTIYSPANDITNDLVKRFGITHYDWIDYEELMSKLYDYDVGICLWLPIKKFYRNLPLKNFDYMSVGLPFITSNFGNLKKYVEDSGAGICIDPNSYKDFESAIKKMFDPEYRRKLGISGLLWANREGNFAVEAREYVSAFEKCSTDHL